MTSLPLKGVKFCSTSVPSEIRMELVSKIKLMGGDHFSHLMSDVDVLIVGDRDTDKYKYCVKHRLDIRFVRPKLIYSLYDNWMLGKDVLITDLQKLPIFDGLNICVSRISHDKKPIVNSIREHLGNLTDSLTINNTCVITTEKSGKRYDKLIEWGIPVVHPIWIKDSIRRGAAMEFQYYEISQDIQEIGVGACDCWDALDEIKRQDQKRHITEDQERTVKVAKRDTQLWNNIMGNVKPPSMTKSRDTSWDVNAPVQDELVKLMPQRVTPQSTLFLDCHFAIYGFDNPDQLHKLIKVIHSHSGDHTTIESTDDLNEQTHLLIPSTMSSSEITTPNIPTVTEWFIERCLHYNEIKLDQWGIPFPPTPPPLNLQICITGFSGIELLHITKLITRLGCQYCDTLTAKRDLLVVNLAIIGLNTENSPKLFTYPHHELISVPEAGKSGVVSTKNKINACKKWSIPIVSTAYLMEMMNSGKLPPLLDYQWCIFAPKDTITRHTTTTITPTLEPPLRHKKNWGRIIGKAQESQLNKSFTTLNLQIPDSTEPSTQISYSEEVVNSKTISKRDTRHQLRELNNDL